MVETAFYLVSKEIALRSGLVNVRYVTADWRYVLDNKDLSRVRFMPDEYITGLVGVEKITAERAKELIRLNGYKMGGGTVQVTETQDNQDNQENQNVENLDNGGDDVNDDKTPDDNDDDESVVEETENETQEEQEEE